MSDGYMMYFWNHTDEWCEFIGYQSAYNFDTEQYELQLLFQDRQHDFAVHVWANDLITQSVEIKDEVGSTLVIEARQTKDKTE